MVVGNPDVAAANIGYTLVAVVVSLLNVAPAAGAAALVQVVPLEVKIFPDVLGATKVGVEVPAPNITLLAVSVVSPVPPLVTANVPAKVIAPEVAELGVKPVVPAENVNTGALAAEDASNVTTPELFL